MEATGGSLPRFWRRTLTAGRASSWLSTYTPRDPLHRRWPWIRALQWPSRSTVGAGRNGTHNADRLHAFLLQDSVVSFHLVRQCAPASRHSQESGGASDRNTGRDSTMLAVRCISSALRCGDHGGSLLFRREHDRSASGARAGPLSMLGHHGIDRRY